LKGVVTLKNIALTIDGQRVEIQEGKTILEAAKEAGIKIPTLCHHPALEGGGACRLCLVELEGSKKFIPSCISPVEDGMVVRTSTPELREARRTLVELLIASHPQECLTCVRNGDCELQSLAEELGVRDIRFARTGRELASDESSPSLRRDPEKCILCGRCVEMCSQVQGISILGFSHRGSDVMVGPAFERGLGEVTCVACGQCASVCPVGAIYEQDHTRDVWNALANPELHVVVQVAPAVRAALGEEFGLAPGTRVTGKLAAALRRLGFHKIFDTQFSADLTIMEEGNEFLERFKAQERLPLITSCSPGWINYCENFFPEFTDNLSSCKSPQQMFGVLVKTYYASKSGVDPSKIYSVSVMPCTAKKYEAARSEMDASGFRDVDAVLTTRELARMIKEAGIDFTSLPDEDFDAPLGISTGAATIFGVTGGVMEAALRTVFELVTGRELPGIEFSPVRGLDGIKEAEVDLDGVKVQVAVASGLGNAAKVLEAVRNGEKEYHFIEIMACPSGCIGGGGQPRLADLEAKAMRAQALYMEDSHMELRKSHDNPEVKALYSEFLDKPGSHKAHQLLHTTYKTPEEKGIKAPAKAVI
jgi:NADP-reducing hydrogenase subunit HndD